MIEAVKWARAQDAGHPLAKLVLMGLVAYSDRAGRAYPSHNQLAEFSGVNRKTIIAAVQRLERLGLIIDSGDRRGKTRQVKVWQLNLAQESLGLHTFNRRKESRHGNSPATVTVPFEALKESRHGNSPATVTVPFEALKESRHGNTEGTLRKKKVSKSRRNESGEPMAEIFDAWNLMAKASGLPIAVSLTDDRKKHLRKRIDEHGLPAILEAIQRVPRSPWLMGENDRGWKADFDFLLQPRSMNRLVEGGYSEGKARPKPGEPQSTLDFLISQRH